MPSAIPEKTIDIDFTSQEIQNIGTMPDMKDSYAPTDPGREFAISLPVIYNEYAANHLLSDNDHASRLAWIKENEQDVVRAIEKPEYIEKTLRVRNNGYYSATHIVNVSCPTSNNNQFMAVAISLSKNLADEDNYHQIITIHPKKVRDIICADGKIKTKYKKF